MAVGWADLPPLSLPEVRLGEIDQIVAAAAHHGLEHVECEALGHLDRDAGGNGKYHPAHDRVDQSRSVVSERFCDATLDVARILEADSAHADGLRHRREIRILELGTEVEKSRRLLLDLDEAERAIVEHDHLDRQV